MAQGTTTPRAPRTSRQNEEIGRLQGQISRLEEVRQKDQESREHSDRLTIKLFIAGLGVVTLQLALNEIGIHGPLIFWGCIALTTFFWGTALFFNPIARAYPALPGRLRPYIGPPAFFTLLIAFAATGWWFDYNTRLASIPSPPSGTFQSPQAKASQQDAPFVPTHARLEFPVEAVKPVAAGLQENIWNWNSTKAEFGHIGPAGERTATFNMVVLSIVFTNPTKMDDVFVHTLNSPGRPLPHYDVISKDARTMFIQFTGDLTGFIIDITNQN